jgi:hypothetical protein
MFWVIGIALGFILMLMASAGSTGAKITLNALTVIGVVLWVVFARFMLGAIFKF